MSQTIDTKMEKIRKKKLFYKNFRKIGSVAPQSTLDKDYENLEKMT
jgi:hypothetical protein